MTLTNAQVLAAADPYIKSHEGFRPRAYLDTQGVPTIAWGRADRGVTLGMVCTVAEGNAWFDTHLVGQLAQMDHGLPWWRDLDLPRATVLCDMGYELGVPGLLGFPTTLGYVMNHQFQLAAGAMATSKWAKQVPNREAQDARIMLTGVMS
jgi:lysozyme